MGKCIWVSNARWKNSFHKTFLMGEKCFLLVSLFPLFFCTLKNNIFIKRSKRSGSRVANIFVLRGHFFPMGTQLSLLRAISQLFVWVTGLTPACCPHIYLHCNEVLWNTALVNVNRVFQPIGLVLTSELPVWLLQISETCHEPCVPMRASTLIIWGKPKLLDKILAMMFQSLTYEDGNVQRVGILQFQSWP